jgi:hypothetical protein
MIRWNHHLGNAGATPERRTEMASKATTDDGWTQVSEDEVDETKIVFDTIGDVFVGRYLGSRNLSNADGAYMQLRFQGEDGTHYFTNANYSLQKAFANIRVGTTCRVTFTDEKDVGQRSMLKVYRVDTRR